MVDDFHGKSFGLILICTIPLILLCGVDIALETEQINTDFPSHPILYRVRPSQRY
jgi:hypothetical protein